MTRFIDTKYDFRMLYECIRHFYPIGVERDRNGFYKAYSGYKEFEQILIDKIHNEDNFKNTWNDYDSVIEKALGKRVVGSTYGQAPSFSSFVQIDTLSYDDMVRTKELHFFVSLLGPFYTVIGQDQIALKVGEKFFGNTLYIVSSPENDFADAFRFVCDYIENRFEGYRFVPLSVCKMTIEGLSESYIPKEQHFIFNALFNSQSHVDLTSKVLGNENYKIENWIKEGYIDDGSYWVAYPPTT